MRGFTCAASTRCYQSRVDKKVFWEGSASTAEPEAPDKEWSDFDRDCHADGTFYVDQRDMMLSLEQDRLSDLI